MSGRISNGMNQHFASNKYLSYYLRLIEAARLRGPAGYVEWHHIIPRCIGGGDEKENLVQLTAREHYVAHRLLTRFTSGSTKAKMESAYRFMFWRMSGKRTSREVARVRQENADATRKRMTGRVVAEETRIKIGNANRGKVVTAETRAKIVAANVGRKHRPESKELISQASRGEGNGMFGRLHTQAAKDAVSKANKGRPAANKGIPMSPEQKAALSASKLGRPAHNKGKKAPVFQCLRCGKMAQRGALARYHKTCQEDQE